ncbi:MAG: OmpA family protein [Flavobacteriales bacterium]|nr:OmpA family protein [Flavobacteriales bacterium]
MKLSRVTWAVFVLLSGMVRGQELSIQKVAGLETDRNIMITGIFGDKVIASRQWELHKFTDRGRESEQTYHLAFAQKTDSYAELSLLEDFTFNSASYDDGSANYCELDSTLYFSSARSGNGEIELYSSKWNGYEWKTPIRMEQNMEGHSSAHPWITQDGSMLIFSSDRPGGMGKMDLWFCNRIQGGWSKAVWMGGEVNSTENELFPTSFNQDIYFSSNRMGTEGLDIFVARKSDQWKLATRMEAPVNSSADDLLLLHLNKETVFLTSSRGGKDEVYLLRTEQEVIEGYTVWMECLGTPVIGADIAFLNELQEEVLRDSTNIDGMLELVGVAFSQNYTVKIQGVPEKVVSRSVIYVRNSEGKIVKEFRPGKNGLFYFELLMGDRPGGPELLENPDESILSLDVQGQLFNKTKGDIGEGEVVYVTDSVGNLLAMTYTSREGMFRFEELRPLKDYHFKSTAEATRMVIFDGDTEIEVGHMEGGFTYEKLSEEEAIRLLDEFRNPIFIGKDEVFIIRNIYYEFDSVRINQVAQSQLKHLAAILRNNPEIGIELSSHTDSRGEVGYNMELSQKRASGAADFLVKEGISRPRIIARGYGESQLLNACDDSMECEEELHALNRRTEIRILYND